MNDNLINNLEYTVSELSNSIKRIIEDNFDYIRIKAEIGSCLLYTSPSPRDATLSRMPSSA